MQITSKRSSMQHGKDFEILDVEYGAKNVRVSVSRTAKGVDEKDLAPGVEIHMTLIEKSKAVSRGVLEVLNAAKEGDSVVILCRSEKILDQVLEFLNFEAMH